MSARPTPSLFTRGLSSLSQSSTVDAQSPGGATTPSEQRDDAKRNLFKTMRALPTQHYWQVFYDRPAPKEAGESDTDDKDKYQAQLETLGTQIESVQDFWRYNNNTPVDQIKMRESIYLFKAGYRPVWEDRRNFNGGSWTFRVPKAMGKDVWTRVQLLAIGENLEGVLEKGDTLCGVGLSVRFNSHLISIWHRDASKLGSRDAILQCVLAGLPEDYQPKSDVYFYKKHSEHEGFKLTPELQAVMDSQKKRDEAAEAAKKAPAAEAVKTEATGLNAGDDVGET